MCQVAVGHSEKGKDLIQKPGWATLLAILQHSGERPQKRSSTDEFNSSNDHDQLAKRLKGASLIF